MCHLGGDKPASWEGLSNPRSCDRLVFSTRWIPTIVTNGVTWGPYQWVTIGLFHPTYRGPITPFITGFWAHLFYKVELEFQPLGVPQSRPKKFLGDKTLKNSEKRHVFFLDCESSDILVMLFLFLG